MFTMDELLNFGCVVYASFPQAKGEELLDVAQVLVQDPMFQVLEVDSIEDKSVRRRFISLLRDSGRTIGFSGGPAYLSERIQLASLDKAIRHKSIQRAKTLSQEALDLEAAFHLVLGGPDPGPDKRSDAKSHLVDSLSEIREYVLSSSRESPLLVTLETFDRDVTHHALIGPTAEAVEVASRVRERVPNFGLTLDLSHVVQLGEDPAEAVAVAQDYIVHAHVAGCCLADRSDPAYGDQHTPFDYPRSAVGQRELVSFLAALCRLASTKGRLPVSLEIRPHGGNPMSVLRASRDFLVDACRLVSKRP